MSLAESISYWASELRHWFFPVMGFVGVFVIAWCLVKWLFRKEDADSRLDKKSFKG